GQNGERKNAGLSATDDRTGFAAGLQRRHAAFHIRRFRKKRASVLDSRSDERAGPSNRHGAAKICASVGHITGRLRWNADRAALPRASACAEGRRWDAWQATGPRRVRPLV